MSVKPTAHRAPGLVVVAGPPTPVPKVVTGAEPTEAESPPSWTYREWFSSVALHGGLLLLMAFWYFNPPPSPPKPLSTRLFGSEFGVDTGMYPTGGLNTEIDLTRNDLIPPERVLEFIPVLEPIKIKPKVKTKSKAKPEPQPPPEPANVEATASGGLDNPNPGAGKGDGFGLAKFGNGGESVNGVMVKVGDPQFTLIWDSGADLDLHVIEPGGKEINWEHPNGDRGGHLDVDNSKGYGPENIYWQNEDETTGELTKGKGPPGEYQWFVMFWGGLDGKVRPTVWKVRVKHAGKVEVYTGRFRALNEKSKRYTLKVEGPPIEEKVPDAPTPTELPKTPVEEKSGP